MKNIFITGASSRIGLTLLVKFQHLYSECKFFCTTRDTNKFKHSLEKIKIDNSRITIIECDLTDYENSKRKILAVMNGANIYVDILVNIAGIFISKPYLETTIKDYSSIIDGNVKVCHVATQLVLPYMLKSRGGSVVNVSSTLGVHTIKGSNNVIYDMAKAAIIQYTKSLAVEMGPSKIRVNCICPGVLGYKDKGTIDWANTDYNKQADIMGLFNLQPLKVQGTAEDVAEGILYLVSEQSKWITGNILIVDGGINL